MQENTSDTKITVSCPSGHRLRGDISLSGNTIRCPRCHVAFVFAPMKPAVAETRSVTDTGVMRILGETPPMPAVKEKKEPITRACPRCSILISPNASVCSHCNCYVGVMPRFMNQLTDNDSGAAHRG